jgi:OOP family OmpA-OmpF porin
VMKAMIKRGIDAERLTAKGYGQNRPLVENTTEEGRQKNRRVQFVIVTKQPKETH